MKIKLLITLIIVALVSCKKEETVSSGKMIFSFDYSEQVNPEIFNKEVAILIKYKNLGKDQIITRKIDLTNKDSNYSFYKFSSPIEFNEKEESYKVLKYSLVDSDGNVLLNVPDSTDLNKEKFDLLIPFYIHVYKNQTTLIKPKMK